MALFNRNLELVRRLVAGGADVNRRFAGMSPCHLAVVMDTNSAALLQELLRHRSTSTTNSELCDVNARDSITGRTPLHYAVAHGNVPAVHCLGEVPGVKLDAADSEGWTALHVAAQRGQLDQVMTLLNAGCVVNCVNVERYTPLHLAVEGHHRDVVEILIGRQADVTATAGPGMIITTVLMLIVNTQLRLQPTFTRT